MSFLRETCAPDLKEDLSDYFDEIDNEEYEKADESVAESIQESVQTIPATPRARKNMNKNVCNLFSVFKIRCWGLLWCEGGNEEKAHEFYCMLNGNLKSIACTDKDFEPNFFTLIDSASSVTL